MSAPEYILLISDLAGEHRFASIVAKRLESLVRERSLMTSRQFRIYLTPLCHTFMHYPFALASQKYQPSLCHVIFKSSKKIWQALKKI